jgi:hypothetical protein
VRAGLSESRLFPLSALTNPVGKTPTKNGEKALALVPQGEMNHEVSHTTANPNALADSEERMG